MAAQVPARTLAPQPAGLPPGIGLGPDWDAAHADVAAGRFFLLDLTVIEGASRVVCATSTWSELFARLDLTVTERAAVESAAARLCAAPHPWMGARRLLRQPVGGLAAEPAPGVYLTWRIEAGGRPVLLTVSRG